jgi:D-amino-acid dehydrogenase
MSEGADSKSSIGVIGAGIQGVCISLNLIKKGFSVVLFDQEDPGKESASYGNAGHFSPYASVPANGPVELNNIEGTSTNISGLFAGTEA